MRQTCLNTVGPEFIALQAPVRPIPPRDRSEFLRDVAAEPAKHEVIGPGIVGRVVAAAQKQHLNPPTLRVVEVGPRGAGLR